MKKGKTPKAIIIDVAELERELMQEVARINNERLAA